MDIAITDITRVIAHEVLRAVELEARPPILSERLIVLDKAGKRLVEKRLVTTVASGSHCVDVTVDDASKGSPFDYSTKMLDSEDQGFIAASRHLAESLSRAQTGGSIKAGSALFVQGTCIADGRGSRFIAIIKADSDQGFYRHVNGEIITLRYVKDMLLGESQRLIKVAFFLEDQCVVRADDHPAGDPRSPEDFSIKVFDHMLCNSADRNAAIYFYSTFLKCRQAANASRKTKQFYDAAKKFINQMNDVTPTKKVELHGDLIGYLRSNKTIIEPQEFAKDIFPEHHQDAFINICREQGVEEAITKDLGLLKGKLRRRSLKFSSNVTIYAPPDAFRDSVKIVETSDDGWTSLKIRGTIETMP